MCGKNFPPNIGEKKSERAAVKQMNGPASRDGQSAAGPVAVY